MVNTENLDVYIEACILHHKYSHNGEYKKANKYHDKVQKIIKKMKETNELDILYPLINHENPSVRLATSYFLYDEFSLEAKNCLLQLANEEPSIAYIAELTLEELEKRKNK